MAGEVNLKEALDLIEGRTLTDRDTGFKNLKNILCRNTTELKDAAVHRICDTLFQVASNDKKAYLKASTPTTRTSTEGRLAATAIALRTTVEQTVRFMRAKTCRALLDHVIDLYAVPKGTPCEPLALNYAKCLTALLSYQPHVGHLRHDDRDKCLAFCLKNIRDAKTSLHGDAGPGAELPFTNGTSYGQSYRSSRSHYKESYGSQSGHSLLKQVAEEMVACLASLTAASDADLGVQFGPILDGVMSLLQMGTTNMKSQQDTFTVINQSLCWIASQDKALTKAKLGQIMRFIRLYWSPKPAADRLRSEMIITLIYVRPYIDAAMLTRESITLRPELLAVLDVIKNEYGSRKQLDQLQMEDMRMKVPSRVDESTTSIAMTVCSLRCAGAQAEANWMTIYTLASLCRLLSQTAGHEESSEDEGEEAGTRPRKRQRMTSEFDELLDSSISAKASMRIAALQVLMFLAQQQAYSCRFINRILDKLSTSCAEDNVDISSWALLAIASFALQKSSKNEALSKRWSAIWQLATRAMSNASTCRPACHLLYIMIRLRVVPFHSIAEFVQTITVSMDLNGPAVLADSVAQLFAYTVQISQQTSPTTSSATAESVLGWLFRAFTPSRFTDRDYAAHHAAFEPVDVIDLISSCLGKPFSPLHSSAARYPCWSAVGQAWLRSAASAELTEYLLLLPPTTDISMHIAEFETRATGSAVQNRPNCEAIILNNMSSELFRTQEAWKQTSLRELTPDMFTFFCKASYVATSIASCTTYRDTRRQGQLQKQAQNLLQSLAGFAKSSSCAQDRVDGMLATFSQAFASLGDHTTPAEPCACEILLCQSAYDIMEGRSDLMEPSGQPVNNDFMDSDDEFDSQASWRAERGPETQALHNDYAAAFGDLALRANLTVYAAVRAKLSGDLHSSSIDALPSAQVLDTVFSLPDYMVFAGRNVVARLPQLGVDLNVDDAARLADFCLDSLEKYKYERCEVALGAILDIMTSVSSLWTDPTNAALHDDGLHMYKWYINIGFSHGILSPSVQCRLANLLLQLCHVNVGYGEDKDCPSARTNIFELIRNGSMAVQFYLAGRISAIFGLFVLSRHPVIFEDLRDMLPKDTSRVEGIAIRLLFFSRLAAAWSSLLRECVYYIVETAGQSKQAADFATHCISDLANALGFEKPQKLFRIFAPQLLRSWLDVQSVTSLPFAVFQYDSLDELVAQNLAELTAQLFVNDKDDGLEMVSSTVKMGKMDLLKRCVAKTEAYCISFDITRSSGEVEGRFRAALNGKDQLNKYLVGQYPAVLAQFFLSAQTEGVDDTWLEKRTNYTEEAKALKEMKGYSCSNRALPVCQQPSFKSKWLCDQIERLGRRTGKADPSKRWDASTFAYVARALLDSIDPALGPLHTCLVIRRLRLLICLGGDVALQDYQLEMLISALRPYLNDSQCADDAMGVLQYLLHRGHPYLSMQMPFVRGTITLMLLQIRKHSRARQESTTQESQHHATLGKMQGFYNWLVDYLKSCQPDHTTPSEAHSSLIQSLAQVQLPGNAHCSTPESTLLMVLIDNGQDGEELFRSVHRDEALLMLSENFDSPTSVDDDCLGEDAKCIRLTQQLWRVSQLAGLGTSFLGWVAGALGRAYAASGERPNLQERDGANRNLSAYEGIARSQAAIARRLIESLYGDNKSEASTAESTFRDALLSFRDADEAVMFESMLPSTVVPALLQTDSAIAPVLNPTLPPVEADNLEQLREPSPALSLAAWAQKYSVLLCLSAQRTAVLSALVPALRAQPSLSQDLFPMIVHILLVAEHGKKQSLRAELSQCITVHFSSRDPELLSKQSYLIKLLLYLRKQALPGEHTQADRLKWLEVDWVQAADAARRCKMQETALLFAESASTPSNSNRRASSRASMSQVTIAEIPQELLLSIFKGVDEPDSFYGVGQPASLDAVLDRLDFEADGFRSLMFRSAQTDTELLKANNITPADSAGMVHSLSMLNLNSLTFALLSSGSAHSLGSSNELLNSARKLQQWDIAAPELASGAPVTCHTAFQELSRATSQDNIRTDIQSVLLNHMEQNERNTLPTREWFGALASIVEMNEVVTSSTQPAIRARWDCMQNRQDWMHLARFEDTSLLSTNRQILFSTLAKNRGLLNDMHGDTKDSRAIEVEALLNVASFARGHGRIQEALTAVRQAGDLVPICEEAGLQVGAAVKLGTASVLWDANEATASVKMMLETLKMSDVNKQDVDGQGRAGLLARLAHQLSDARLEKPDNILSHYLEPAIKELRGRTDGPEAGEVFHEFATFCDKQLQNAENKEDFDRMARLTQQKLEEVQELERLSAGSRRGDQRDNYARDLQKAQKWYKIDDDEYQELKKTRDTFTQQSLKNYMLTLRATNTYNISVLRLFALWLENADVPEANDIASRYLANIPSWKFVLLMNQLMSRLEADGSTFQKVLGALLLNICSDHPHHSLHHLFATTRSSTTREKATISRHNAAMTIRSHLSGDPKKDKLLRTIFDADRGYNDLANEDGKQLGQRVSTSDLQSTRRLRQVVPGLKVPPITMNIPIRPNGDYSDVPVVTRIGSTVRLMSGISKPKSITIYASNGQQYNELFKSGDDLRQDAIMEQVFEEVSKMLRNHKATRQRNLVVRTYKVIPLTSQSGAIEFVPNSMSFGDFLKPAHQRYHPSDWKDSKCREVIIEAQHHSTETRVKAFRKACEHMHPVMRYFFFERFSDPEEWFQKRTAYTRTTATMSMLGYVLGLGDRHCQNIMLDEKSGEVVHIDLGVAFEAGRVLPIPEMVPFRLSRDVVDGMGITKTEGVFRRCCEFTMDALREDQGSIMTLLNVLRYDPLYTWNVSPLRAKRMQEETGREQGGAGASKKKESEAGEAERALSIVEKKLSKTLSTAATVNELIQQATDEKNLATLYHGWSAWN